MHANSNRCPRFIASTIPRYLSDYLFDDVRRQQSGSLPESGPENYLTLRRLISRYIAGVKKVYIKYKISLKKIIDLRTVLMD